MIATPFPKSEILDLGLRSMREPENRIRLIDLLSPFGILQGHDAFQYFTGLNTHAEREAARDGES